MRAFPLLAITLASSAAQAAPLTYDDAVRKAVATSPGSTAAASGVAVARSDARAAGSLPDPRLTIGVDNLPVSGPPAFTLDRDEMTGGRIGVQQDVPNLAKRHAAQAQAGATIAMAKATQIGRLRQIRLGTGLAWIDLAYAKRRLVVMDAILARLRALPAIANTGIASGTLRPAQTLQTRQAIAGLEDRRDELVATVSRAMAMLARWTGDPTADAVGDPPAADLDPVRLRAELAHLPDIITADATVRRAQADVQTAQAEKRPNWGFEVSYQRRDPRYGDMVSAGMTISLPLFARTRQDPRIAARQSAAVQADAEREDVRRALAADLESGLADHVMHHEQWMRARDVLLPLARQKADLETTSYGADRATLQDVVEARTMLADAEMTILDREADVARDAVRLSITFGSDDR